MDSIRANLIIKCPCCGRFWGEHPTSNSICWRYRPTDVSEEELAEITRQKGLTVADLNWIGSLKGHAVAATEPTITASITGDTAKPLFLGAYSAGVLPGQLRDDDGRRNGMDHETPKPM